MLLVGAPHEQHRFYDWFRVSDFAGGVETAVLVRKDRAKTARA